MDRHGDMRALDHGQPALLLCKPHEMLGRFGEKWTYLTVILLAQADAWVRSSDIKAGIYGISQRMLTVTLRNLERDGFVDRRVYPEVPPRVEYCLTPLAQDMMPALKTFTRWIDANWSGIETAREAYDDRRSRID